MVERSSPLGLMCCEDLPLGVVADNFDVEEATQIKFLRPVERHDGWRLGICCLQGSRDGVKWSGVGMGMESHGSSALCLSAHTLPSNHARTCM